MIDIGFSLAGAFKGASSGPDVITRPTSIQFGPDGRLYVAEQDGSINAFTIGQQPNGNYIATSHEELLLADGKGVVQALQNHNDDGSLNDSKKRQVTGIVVAGTSAKPVLYVSSNDPRISKKVDVDLDTNSGVVSRVTWTGNTWEVVDIIRGLPRSEENHAVNGLVLSPNGSKLYVAVGGNTNNGAPSDLFAYAGEYALSGTILEVDLNDINSRPILTDPAGGQGGQPRQYVYDLPTLDDPTVANDGTQENGEGLDVSGPWGGNDGFNMAVLPADAPLRIYADGFRNNYDLVITDDGKLYTVDNGSNNNVGGDPVLDANGNVTNLPNNGGTGDPEPLFLVEDGGYYGHPAPVRANQNLAWTIYNDQGNPDNQSTPNSVANLSNLVPSSLKIENGFLIDPTKFTGNPDRLKQSGVRIERSDLEQSNTLLNLGSSSNGLVEYTSDAFGGALIGDLFVTQFNGNLGRINLSSDGSAPSYETVDGLTGLEGPLDVTTGPNGTLWVAEIESNKIKAFTPSQKSGPNLDSDGDGINNVIDPFIRDASNGKSAVLTPNQELFWDFSGNQDDRPGPGGFGGGLTGVMLDGSTNFDEFFQEPSTLPGQNLKLDNVKFITAAGGGTTVIESVSNGDPFQNSNNGEYLFHTGVTIAPTVNEFTIQWNVFNALKGNSGTFQQIGGYIGTGDQSNYLKFVAIQHPSGEIQLVLEDDDVVQENNFLQANDIFKGPVNNSQIFLELTINPSLGTAKPTVVYETEAGNKTVTSEAISLAGTAVLDAIRGDYNVAGQKTGLAVGLMSSNVGTAKEDTFQATFNDIKITSKVASSQPEPTEPTLPQSQPEPTEPTLPQPQPQPEPTGPQTQPKPTEPVVPQPQPEPTVTQGKNSKVLYRVNAGGNDLKAKDGGPDWLGDNGGEISQFLANPGSNSVAQSDVSPGDSVANSTLGDIFASERWDQQGGAEMQWAFQVDPGKYNVRLFMGNSWSGASSSGQRLFDVALEGRVPNKLQDIDLSGQFGHTVGGMISSTVQVSDGVLNIDFLHVVQNPLINGIEIRKASGNSQSPPSASATQLPPVIRIEAEDAESISGYGVETANAASGEQALSLLAGEQSEQGRATFKFDGLTGTYDVLAGVVENDGLANFSVELTDKESGLTTDIDPILPENSFSTQLASSPTALSQTVAQGLNLTPGDRLTLRGVAQANESTSLDFIELVSI